MMVLNSHRINKKLFILKKKCKTEVLQTAQNVVTVLPWAICVTCDHLVTFMIRELK